MRKVTTPADPNPIGPYPSRPSKTSLRRVGTAPPSAGSGAPAAPSAIEIVALQSFVPPEQIGKDDSPDALEKVIAILREHTGNDFSAYKRHALYRRIARRMGLHQISSVSDYAHYLRTNLQEVDLLFKEILIGVTSFFRDPAVWDYLRDEALPGLLATHPGGKLLRAWVPACSTGEEAYTLAIVFKEALERLEPECRFSDRFSGGFSLQIFATDLDADAIEKAQRGVFSSRIAEDVSPERLHRFFVAEENSYRVSSEIREMIVFTPQNIAMDAPLANLDILACRNLLIYFEQDLRSRLIPLFHHALNRDGLLLVGSAETVGSFQSLFSLLDASTPLYRRIEAPSDVSFPPPRGPQWNRAPISAKPGTENARFNLRVQADQFLLQNFSPPAVVVNHDGDILYFNGRIEKYLEPAAGKSNWNVYAMAREDLRHALASALKKSIRQQTAVTVAVTVVDPAVRQNGGAVQAINLTVTAIDGSDARLLIIVFTDVAAPDSGQPHAGPTKRLD